MTRTHSQGFIGLIRTAMRNFLRNDCLRLSAAISYYSAFSLAPLLLVILAVAGFFADDELVRSALDDELRRELGPSGALVVQDMVSHARKPAENFLAATLAVVLLLLGASGLFGQLQGALDKIWNVEPASGRGVLGFIRDRFLSFLMVLGTGFLLLISMILSVALQSAADRMTGVLPFHGALRGALEAVGSFAVITLLFAAIFKVMPKVNISWKVVWTGAVFTSGLFVAGKTAIAWYLGREATATNYGPAAALILVLMWFYYSSIILLFGAEFTRATALQNHMEPDAAAANGQRNQSQ